MHFTFRNNTEKTYRNRNVAKKPLADRGRLFFALPCSDESPTKFVSQSWKAAAGSEFLISLYLTSNERPISLSNTSSPSVIVEPAHAFPLRLTDPMDEEAILRQLGAISLAQLLFKVVAALSWAN